MNAIFTGFEPFGPHGFNPSAVAAEEAARCAGAAYELLEVTFEAARRFAPAAADYDRVILLGLAAATPHVRLERFGHNLRMVSPDAGQECDPDAVMRLEEEGPLAVETTFDVGELRRRLVPAWDARHSRDAGTYVCNAVYYHCLRAATATEVVFLHVPKWDAGTARAFGRALAAALE